MNYNSDMEEQYRIYIENREYSEYSFINANSLENVTNPGIDPVDKKLFSGDLFKKTDLSNLDM